MFIYYKINIYLAEWETEAGEFIALTSKSYMAKDDTSGDEKRGTKGIPHSIKVSMDNFRDILYQEHAERDTISIDSLQLNRDKQMCRTNMTKQGLSDIFVKLAVASDKITCSPIKLNDQFI